MSAPPERNVVHAEVADPRRWFALVVIAIAQLMVVLDSSIVNIALPHAARALSIAPKNYQWAVTAYLLTFGGFLLLGGRVGDYLGRKKAFQIGLLGFALASLLGGFAVNQAMLFGARGLQGIFGALLTPAALSLISVTFTDSKERAKAFGVYGALSGVGAAIGLIAGGLLTQYLNWRWCLFVNTPMALIAFTLSIPNVRESKVEVRTKYDVPGALTVTAGMLAIVYGVSQASTDGWGSRTPLTFMCGGGFLLVVFFLIEQRVSSPLLPMRLLTNRYRAAAYLSQLLLAFGLYGMFLFMTFYFQTVHGYSAVKSGLCFLPFSLGVIISATTASQLLPKFGPRPLATVGSFMGSLGLLGLSMLHPESSYALHVMPCLLMMSLGMGGVFVSLSSTALFNIEPRDTGAASAVLSTTQQIGGSFGTAIQNTIAVSGAASFLIVNAHGERPTVQLAHAALVHGFGQAFRFGSLMLFVGGLSFFFIANVDRHHLKQHDGPSAAH
jgi:EmrB/QacA subfamily drug resistance transporter